MIYGYLHMVISLLKFSTGKFWIMNIKDFQNLILFLNSLNAGTMMNESMQLFKIAPGSCASLIPSDVCSSSASQLVNLNL